MRRAFVSCALIALGACASFSSSPDAPTDDDGGVPEAGVEASADAGVDAAETGCGHTFCESFDESNPPGVDWNLDDPTETKFTPDGGDVGAALDMSETVYPGPALVHAIPSSGKHVHCGGDLLVLATPMTSLPSVTLIALDLDNGEIDVIVDTDQTTSLLNFDAKANKNDTANIGGSLSKTRFTRVEIEADVNGTVAGSVGGVRGVDTLPFTPGAFQTVRFALGPHDVGGGWTVRFDQLWCDVE